MAWINYIISKKLYDEKFLTNWTNGVFLIRKDNKLLLRASDVDKNGKQEDFVVWNSKTGKPALWCSDENHYYDADVETPLHGEYTVTFADGSKVPCITAFDALTAEMKQYTLDWASDISGVPASRIEEACVTYATNGPAFICWGLGGGDMHGYNATNSAMAKTILRIITGNIDVPGGEYLGEPGPMPDGGKKLFPVRDAEMELSEKVTPEARAKYLGNDQFRIMSWKGFEKIDKCYKKAYNIPRPVMHQLLVTPTLAWDAILKGEPYPVKAMIAWSSNPLAWAANTKHVYEALNALDLLVVVEYWKTPTAVLADYIMPACDWMERPMATTCEDALDSLSCGDRGCQPLGERRMDFDFFSALGRAMGQEEYWTWDTYEDLIKYRISRVPGLTYEKVVEDSIWQHSDLHFYKYEDILPNGQVRGSFYDSVIRTRLFEFFINGAVRLFIKLYKNSLILGHNFLF